MSDVLDRVPRELQQRLESTRAVAQEHERVRVALEALSTRWRRWRRSRAELPVGRPSQAQLRWARACGRHPRGAG